MAKAIKNAVKPLLAVIFLVCLMAASSSCISTPPKYFFAEPSPDRQKTAYVKEYYLSLFRYPAPVYPRYSLVVRQNNQDQELFRVDQHELMLRFVLIAWTKDSQKVGFLLEANNSLPIVKAFDVESRKEIPITELESELRLQMVQQWSQFIPPGEDPLALARRPSLELLGSFNQWRRLHFGQVITKVSPNTSGQSEPVQR